MAKWCNSKLLDSQGLNYMKNATRICVCTSQPTTVTEATTTYMLAIKTITSSDFTGPATGDAGGLSRKITSNQHSATPITNSGNAQHIAHVDTVNNELCYVVTCQLQPLTANNTVTIPAYDVELGGPV